MRHGSLFSGIGGFDLAADWMGWENVFHCEWNKFGQQVLKYYWPKAISYEDITKTDFTIHRGRIDILTGGFPCQPYSSAGKRLGKEDERHLWPQMLRCIREVKPRWVVGENVLGIANWNGGLVFNEVQADLEAEGYEVQPYVLPAAAVNAPHRRDRVWFVAHSTRSSKRTDELRGVRCENGEACREGSQTIHNAFGPDGIKGDVTYSNLHGCNQCNSDNEVNTSEGRINALGDTNESNGNGDVADTMRNGSDKSREGRQSEQFDQNGIERRDATHSEFIRLQHGTKTAQVLSEERDAKAERCESSLPIKTNGYGYKPNWQNFPTVSPICNGDDGVSDRLDSITFSKWRNESIKAGGNAIVPQVVYQIFKTIEQYENLPNV